MKIRLAFLLILFSAPAAFANDPPVASNRYQAGPSGEPLQVGLMGSDPNGDNVTYTIVDPPQYGTLSDHPLMGAAPVVTYTPNTEGFTGLDSFTYRANDGMLDSNLATVNITIYPASSFGAVIEGPEYILQNPAATERITLDGSHSPGAIGGYWEIVEGEGTGVSIVTDPNMAHVDIDIPPSPALTKVKVRFTVDSAYGTTDVALREFLVTQNVPQVRPALAALAAPAQPFQGTAATVNFSVVTAAGNRPPDLPVTLSSLHTPEETPLTISLGRPSDPDGDATTVEVEARHGTVTLNPATWEATFTPNPGVRRGILWVTVKDGRGGGLGNVLSIFVGDIETLDDSPAAPEIIQSVDFGASTDVTLPEGAEILGTVMGGTLVPNGGDSYRFTPALGFDGTAYAAYTVTDPVSGRTSANRILFNVRHAPVGGVEILVDGMHVAQGAGDFGENDLPFDSARLADGDHTFTVRVLAANGTFNQRAFSARVDNTPPDTDFLAPTLSNDSFVGGTINPVPLKANASDVTSGVLSVLFTDPKDGTTKALAPQGGNYSLIYTDHEGYDTKVLTDGVHSFKMSAIDTAGNVSPDKVRKYAVDNTPPANLAISLPTMTPEKLVRGVVGVEASGQDLPSGTLTAGSGMKSLDLSLMTPATLLKHATGATLNWTWNTAGWSDGVYALKLAAADNVVNRSQKIESGIIIDNSAPALAITKPAANATVEGVVAIDVIATDLNGIKSVVWKLDGAVKGTLTNGPSAFSWDSTGEPNGFHQITAEATDNAGNTSSKSITVATGNPGKPIKTTPNLGFVNRSNGALVSGRFPQGVNAPGNTHKVAFLVDGVAAGHAQGAPFMLDWDTSLLSNGAHTLQAHAVNAQGITFESVSLSVVVDNLPPQILSANLSNGDKVSGVKNIQISFSDNNAFGTSGEVHTLVDGRVVALRQNIGGTSGAQGYLLDTTALSNGLHTVALSMRDAAGNTTQNQWDVTVQNAPPSGTAPEFRIITPTDKATLAGLQDLKIEMTGGDEPTEVIFRIDGVNHAGVRDVPNPNRWHFSWFTTATPDGAHTLEIIAASSSGFTSQSVLVTVLNTPPTISFLTPDTDTVLWGVKNITMKAFSANNTPVNNVLLRVGSVNMFQMPGNQDPFNQLYAYSFDTEAIDPNTEERRFPDGDYVLYAEVTDVAGNKAFVTRPIKIDTKNIPPSVGIIRESPADGSMPVTDQENQIFVKFENVAPDLTAVTPDSLKVFIKDEDDVYQRVTGGAIRVLWADDALRVTGVQIPPNSEVKFVVAFQDMDGRALRKTCSFERPIAQAIGGTVRKKGLTLTVPRNALPKDLFIRIDDMSGSALVSQADLATPEINKDQKTVFGPVKIYGLDESRQTEFVKLNSAVSLAYDQKPAAGLPIDDLDKVLMVQALDPLGVWKSVGLANGGAPSIRATPVKTKTITVPLTSLGVFRVAALSQPMPGIHEFFNFPNPFSPDEGGTTFHYILGEDSGVKLIIYDLFGNLVKIMESPAGALGGRASQNIVPWDGRNGEGDVVASGGYIIHLFATDSRGTTYKAKTKTGVVR